MNVILFPCRAPAHGTTLEHRAFCLARQEMNNRFVAWLRAEPGADFRSEIEPTLDVLRQLHALEATP